MYRQIESDGSKGRPVFLDEDTLGRSNFEIMAKSGHGLLIRRDYKGMNIILMVR